MKFCSSGFPVRMPILSPAKIDEDDEDEDDKKGEHTTAKTCSVKLEPGCSRGLINDLVAIGLALGGVLVGRFTF